MKPRIHLSAALLLLAAAGCGTGTPPPRGPASPAAAAPATGDLIFLDLDCGPPCDAIEEVTLEQFEVRGPRLSHVGLLEVTGGAVRVIEAWPAGPGRSGGVVRAPLDRVLARVRGGRGQPGGYHLVRPLGEAGELAAHAAARATELLGSPYDEDFLPENGAYYCSELVYEAFRRAAGGREVFPLRPMSFGRPGSRARATWEEHYRRRALPVPEGAPGISPLGIFLQATGRVGAAR